MGAQSEDLTVTVKKLKEIVLEVDFHQQRGQSEKEEVLMSLTIGDKSL